jgi:hypothetical protein
MSKPRFNVGNKTGLRYFGIEDIRGFGPCYDPVKFVPESWRGTAIDILKLDAVPAPDRLWVVLRPEITSERVMRLFAVWCARQVQHLMKDARSIAALDVAERFANGHATREDVDAARDAAWAVAWTAARDAAWAAAWDAARDAADAARDAARAKQADIIRELIPTI